jgi:hypothetical protein
MPMTQWPGCGAYDPVARLLRIWPCGFAVAPMIPRPSCGTNDLCLLEAPMTCGRAVALMTQWTSCGPMTQWPGCGVYDHLALLWRPSPYGPAVAPITLWPGCGVYDPVAWLWRL